jgi:hypothetical protein
MCVFPVLEEEHRHKQHIEDFNNVCTVVVEINKTSIKKNKKNDSGLLACDTVSLGTWSPTFWKNIAPLNFQQKLT